MTIALWLFEFLLEFAGAHFALKKRLLPLAAFLGLRAFADVACALIQYVLAPNMYAWAWYAQTLVQYILFAFLVVYGCAKLLNADRLTAKSYPAMFAGLMILALVFFHSRPLTMPNILHFAAGTYMILGVFLCLGLAMATEREWVWLGIAPLIMACSDGLLSALQGAHHNVTAYYPYGELAALLLWVIPMCPRGTWAFMADMKFSFPPKIRCRAIWLDDKKEAVL